MQRSTLKYFKIKVPVLEISNLCFEIMHSTMKKYIQNRRPTCFWFHVVGMFCMQFVCYSILYREAINVKCCIFSICKFYAYVHIIVASETRFSKQFCWMFQYFERFLCVRWQRLTDQVKWIFSPILVCKSNTANIDTVQSVTFRFPWLHTVILKCAIPVVCKNT